MGRRLSASETIAALEHLGFPAIQAATLRRWRHLGLLSPGRGYEPAEVAAVYRRRVAREAA
ncbi:hypothetical protein [Sciscionella sediminilitoris]|uniref:hypothetical protein n=1 Tax=Sciscionella sediminilitoris TaxID=1445613 RepID=UPI0004DF16B2|nr:hypothetical protein [Sciscionella sp. SE31]